MFQSLLIAASLYTASGAQIFAADHKTKAINPSMVDEINAMKTTWRAHVSPRFANATVADVKMLLGTIMPGEPNYYEPEVERTVFKGTAIPDSFDVRTAFPQCSAITSRVRDQSNCGSCWAFGSTEAFNDRYCIKTGDAKTVFSAEDTNSCCSGIHCGFSMGCNGGQPSGAWKWFTETGVSTGADWGDIGTGSSCKPYSMQSCAHHVSPPPGMVACDTLPSYSTPHCTSTCTESGYGTPYSQDKHKASSHYSVKNVANIQQELMEKGTVSVAMTVYEDFEAYADGVYQHVTGKSLGGHAIKLVGWGVAADGTPYWTCSNSWNKSWGKQGTFNILRGSNECGIEGSVVAGDA